MADNAGSTISNGIKPLRSAGATLTIGEQREDTAYGYASLADVLPGYMADLLGNAGDALATQVLPADFAYLLQPGKGV